MGYIKEGYLRAVLQGGTQLTLNLINEIFKAEPKSSILIGIEKCLKTIIVAKIYHLLFRNPDNPLNHSLTEIQRIIMNKNKTL